MSELSSMDRRALRNWLWQLAYHELDDASVTVGAGSSRLVRSLRRLAMRAVAPEDGIACTRCGNGPAAPCCRKGCIHGDDCIHCVARKAMTPATQLSYAKKLLRKAINEPGAIGSSDGVNYALLEEITDFLNLPKGAPASVLQERRRSRREPITKVDQSDTSRAKGDP